MPVGVVKGRDACWASAINAWVQSAAGRRQA